MFHLNGYCAILLWTLSIFIILSKTGSVSINLNMLNSRNHGAALKHTLNITRNHDGDIIILKDTNECDDKKCMEISTSTAVKYRRIKKSRKEVNQCRCQCLGHLQTYREDMGICVNDIGECSLIPFVSSMISTDTAERIPFVFLPLNGQLIYPSKELLFEHGM
ncbi:CLUMA_CG008965, isoform A [Clunio marinus]|uniref:CLUMA_CG008965, isoform A n=1 Tax=Clunio marinus TaxID=568069 RepID=A0A1J1I5D5_9DIPT|nr:CLUMA_CG008965, isoform A [Clunio marinus]